MTDLTILANRYKSDKGNQYKCAHHYTRHYQPIFEELAKAGNVSLFEIGLNRDDTSDVPSLRMYRDFFGDEAEIAGMDIRPEFAKFNEEGFLVSIGDQSNPDHLNRCAQSQFSIIIDDGSHASSHQQISLRELWKAVRPGGFYVIEDLHWQPFQERCPLTRTLCEQWLEGNPASSEFLETQWVEGFIEETSSMKFLSSASSLHSPKLTAKALFIAQKK